MYFNKMYFCEMYYRNSTTLQCFVGRSALKCTQKSSVLQWNVLQWNVLQWNVLQWNVSQWNAMYNAKHSVLCILYVYMYRILSHLKCIPLMYTVLWGAIYNVWCKALMYNVLWGAIYNVWCKALMFNVLWGAVYNVGYIMY